MAKITLCFTIDSEDDRDIALFFDKVRRGDKSEIFRDVMKVHLGNAGLTLADIHAALLRIEQRLSGGAVTPTVVGVDDDNLVSDDSEIDKLASTLGL